MKRVKIMSLLACFLLLFGCGTTGGNDNNSSGSNTGSEAPNEQPADDEEQAVEDLTGYVVSISNDGQTRILVTGKHPSSGGSGISATIYTLEESTTVEDSEGEPLEAMDLLVGMKVTVWNSGIVAESFPAQSGAIKVMVDADQDELEQKAVAKALEGVDAGYPWHVEEVTEQGEQLFKVTLKNLLDDSEPVDIEVEVEKE
ncbi:DUF3221 domain-containing protein [Sutcliffiella horikoshii]|uniref:DUF3221 domain-containing protein n=1 Tax=Sutcliffiella horikoshii TaxID=79883 RepID=A0A5D4SZ35_9BACI|nr:DUF3221 domain-containing protein [Sutcliffiella horikoshii]TYS68229.1 DUF3221 domain-containing protein [Sutcliffiella horikoshii]